MDRVLITWSIPNLITIWMMLLIGLFALALVSQYAFKWTGNGNSAPADNSGGY